jgi:hypothetical protein
VAFELILPVSPLNLSCTVYDERAEVLIGCLPVELFPLGC